MYSLSNKDKTPNGQLQNFGQMDQLLEHLPVALLRLSREGVVMYANSAACGVLGKTQIVGLGFESIVEGLGRSMRNRLLETYSGSNTRSTEMGRCMKNGQEVFLQVSLMRMDDGDKASAIAVLSDKTELKMLEAQFVQSQKMQAVGQLAGGVAHDFNNLLTAISGHTDLMLLRHEKGTPDYGDLIQIRQNTVRAAALVKQLLAYSRKQTLRPKNLDLTKTLSELTTLLNRLLGEKVRLKIENCAGLNSVHVDERQFEQVIMNLAVNARDSMADGGEVVISTDNLTLDRPESRDHATIPAGQYAIVKVRDHGTGIHQDDQSKIFEPFFTTKKVGEGTGLGLSTVYGIVKQTGGFIFVSSAPGQGTEFEIYLPAYHSADRKEKAPKPKQDSVLPLSASGRILLVEDEAPVRSFAVRVLKMRGFDVDEAECGEDALEMVENCREGYDLFISDIIMPGIDGPGWVEKALQKHPDTKVIFISGYAKETLADEHTGLSDATFLPKPFSLTDLVKAVNDCLS